MPTITKTVGQTIREQVETPVLWALGASDLHGRARSASFNPGLVMNVRVLPFNARGKRMSRPRVMELLIELTPWDDYTITVSYHKKLPSFGGWEYVTHQQFEHVYASELSRVLLSIDSMDDRKEV
jgi:hypothetical protein